VIVVEASYRTIEAALKGSPAGPHMVGCAAKASRE
jgi:hypothetical protein